MLLGFHYMYYYSNAYEMNQYLASRGYLVLSVNYRSGIGYGLDFREALHYGAAGASEYNDVQGAGVYLRSREDVDSKRIGVWGGPMADTSPRWRWRGRRICLRLGSISMAFTIGISKFRTSIRSTALMLIPISRALHLSLHR
jgi:hypothetical protein